MKSRRYEYLTIVLVMLAMPFAVSITTITTAPSARNDAVLVIGRNAAELVTAAGGRLIGPGSAPWGALATGGPEFVTRVKAAGAWRVSDAGWLMAICG